MSENLLDRHLGTPTANKAAIIWQGEPEDDVRILTYQQLQREVCRFANVLRKHGVPKGDRVMIYMPMIPELPVAMLACARVGAVHTVVFGGFSAQSLIDRINDSAPSGNREKACVTLVFEKNNDLDQYFVLPDQRALVRRLMAPKTASPTAELDYTARPNCSLDRRGKLCLFATAAIVTGLIALIFAAFGAWLVLPFAGIESLFHDNTVVIVDEVQFIPFNMQVYFNYELQQFVRGGWAITIALHYTSQKMEFILPALLSSRADYRYQLSARVKCVETRGKCGISGW